MNSRQTRCLSATIGAILSPMRRPVIRLAVGVVALGAIAGVQAAQAPATPPAFDVVSIKPASFAEREESMARVVESLGVCGNTAIRILGNRVAYPFVSVCGLIRLAYDVRDDEIAGPDWIRAKKTSALYAFDAPAPPGTPLTVDAARQMLRTMLADRFKFKMHWGESDVHNVYNLVPARKGPTLDQPDPHTCGTRTSPTAGNIIAVGPGVIARCAPTLTMMGLADELSRHTDRPVLDKTGIEGSHAFSLRWTPDGEPARDGLPGLVTAIEDQLGLHLEPGRSRTRVLVIDQVEKPDPD
jgi:bla regulator protein blaR1